MVHTPPVDVRRYLPLSQQTFQILLSVHDEPLHGYAIIADIQERTNDEVVLMASTLYDALARLLDQGLIDEIATPAKSGKGDSRRRYYGLTALGRKVAEAEAQRLARLVDMAREKRLLRARR